MTDPEPTLLRRPPPPFRTATVRGVRDRTPRLRCISLEGPELVGFTIDEPAGSARLLPPTDGHLELPDWNGNEFLFADGSRPPIRTVTPLRADPIGGRLDVEVVLHGEGPLSAWAQTVEPGSPVSLSGPGRGYGVDASARRFLVAGDESALPAITQLIPALPTDATVDIVIEIAHPDGRAELPDHAGSTVEWCETAPGARIGAALISAIQQRTIDQEARVWVAGEAAAVQRIRKHLFEATGLPRTRAVVRGYWKTGEVWDG